MIKLKENSSGYVLLISVLILGAVGLASVLSLILIGVSSSRSALVTQQSAQARFLADTCIESGLEQIRESNSYTGGNTLSFGANSCIYDVANLGGNIRQINATGTVDQIVRKVKVTTSALSPKIIISSWQEVGDF
jgi:Tfp pilus assembly protein PilX